MHELSLAVDVLRVAREVFGARRPLARVRIAVGELSAVDPELLKFAWDAVVTGTEDEGATLEVDWHPAQQTCPACGIIRERADGSWLRLCPRCEAPLQVVGGDELDVTKVWFGRGGTA